MLWEGQFIDRYQVIERLGSDSFSTRYLAVEKANKLVKPVKPDRKVIIHVLHHPIIPSHSRVDENAFIPLKHKNIAELIRISRQRDIDYFIQECVEGESLEAILPREGSLGPLRTLKISIDVCSALCFAHAKNMTHGDLQPFNVFITKEGRTKVADFGIARLLKSQVEQLDLTHEINVISFPGLERAMSNTPIQSDICQLGALMWEMLLPEGSAARRQWDAELAEDMEAIGLHPDGGTISKNQANRVIPKSLDDVIWKARTHDPDFRYQSAQEFLSALRLVKNKLFPESDNCGGVPPNVYRVDTEGNLHLIVAKLEGPSVAPSIGIPRTGSKDGSLHPASEGGDPVIPAVLGEPPPAASPTECDSDLHIPMILRRPQGRLPLD